MIRTNNRRDLEKMLKLNGGSSTELSQIDYGIDVTNRIIYLEDEIDIYTAGFVQSRINAIISLSTQIFLLPNYDRSSWTPQLKDIPKKFDFQV